MLSGGLAYVTLENRVAVGNVVVYVVEAIDDVTHNLVTCALVLTAGDLKSARLEDFDANVWVALHAKP